MMSIQTGIDITRRLGRVVALLVILLLALVGYGFLLRPGEILYSPYSDIIAYHLAAKEVLYRSWQSGRGIPFWRADQLSGGPAFTSPNALYTNPLHLLFYFFSPPAAMGWTIWIHLVVMAIVHYAAGRLLGLGRGASLLMAAAGLFSFKVLMAVYAGWLSVLPSLALCPLLFATVFRLVQRPGLGTALAVAGSGAVALHGGHLQLVNYTFLFLMGYVLVTQVRAYRSGHRRLAWQVCRWACCAGLLGAGLAAYLLPPMAAEAPLISRGVTPYTFFQRSHSLGLRRLLTFVYPEALGTPLDGSYPGTEMWEDVAYFGILPLLLALVGVMRGWRRPATPFLTAGFVLSVLTSLDTHLVYLLYNYLPGFHLFRLPGRLLFLASFFGIALAGVGLEAILVQLRRHRVGVTGSLILVAGVIFLVAAEGTLYARRYLSTVEYSYAIPMNDYRDLLAKDPSLFRVAPVTREVFTYGWAAPMGLQLITGYEPYNLWHYQQYMQLMEFGDVRWKEPTVGAHFIDVARWDLLDAMNVKYILSPHPLPQLSEHLDMVAYYPGQVVFILYRGMRAVDVFLYRNKHVLPRVHWAKRVAGALDEDEMVLRVRQDELHDAAVVLGLNRGTQAVPESLGDSVTTVAAVDGYFAVETESRTDRFLVISEVWHPGWRARLDGRTLPLYRTNVAFMGTWIPAGTHRLVLGFRPLHWYVALGISLRCGAIFVTCIVVCFVRSRRVSLETQPG